MKKENQTDKQILFYIRNRERTLKIYLELSRKRIKNQRELNRINSLRNKLCSIDADINKQLTYLQFNEDNLRLKASSPRKKLIEQLNFNDYKLASAINRYLKRKCQ